MNRVEEARPVGPRPLHLRWSSVGLVMAGGGVGAAAREAIGQVLPTASGQFPTATLLVNLSGAFVLGALLEALVRSGDDAGGRRRARLIGGTGFCGAFTTYSTFAVELVQLGRHGHWSSGLVYLLVSVFGGLVAAALGITVAATHARATVARLPVDPDVETDIETVARPPVDRDTSETDG